jgi:DNA-binding protein HU-beta
MNKKDLVKNVADLSGLTSTDATKAVSALMETIANTLKEGDDVNLVGFLKFSRRRRDARVGRNPKTGAQIEIPAAWVVKVSIGKLLKDTINS